MISKSGAVTLALLAGLVAGCTQPGALPQSRAVVYSTDFAGKAPVCTVSDIRPEPGKTVTATITTDGGGWCALTVADNGKPYAAGLVEHRPNNGNVYIHTVGDDTRVDYTPDSVVRPDAFAVQLLPGDAIVSVTVKSASVQPAAAPITEAPQPKAAAPAKATRAKPHATRARPAKGRKGVAK